MESLRRIDRVFTMRSVPGDQIPETGPEQRLETGPGTRPETKDLPRAETIQNRDWTTDQSRDKTVKSLRRIDRDFTSRTVLVDERPDTETGDRTRDQRPETGPEQSKNQNRDRTTDQSKDQRTESEENHLGFYNENCLERPGTKDRTRNWSEDQTKIQTTAEIRDETRNQRKD
ncbi:hypothetical protein WMY93_006997 [Mugilogobius chulae]|uniref:Uncharacterized protein n=1 Tax=Mugilogobius chulae TaxID=88201 RepID=A0AAW0PUZ5_9GOBI